MRPRSALRPPSISRWAVNPIISRRRSVSALFSISVRRFIISLVIGGSSNQVGVSNPTVPANQRWPPQSRPPATALFDGARAGGFALPSYTINGTRPPPPTIWCGCPSWQIAKVPGFAKAFAGRWRIVEMDNWDSDFLDLVEQAHLTFAGKSTGEIAFGTLKGFLDVRYGARRFGLRGVLMGRTRRE